MKNTRFLWLFLCLFSSNVLAQLDGLQITLSPLKKDYLAADPLTIEFSLHNTSGRSIRVLKWGTPFEGEFNTNMFEVAFGVTQISYTGRQIKRRPPEDEDYLSLLPGESISTRIDLSLGYDFGRAGQYTVRYRDILLKTDRQAFALQEKSLNSTRSASIILQLIEDRPRRMSMQASPETFVSCSAQQQSTISATLISAQAIARESYLALNGASAGGRADARRYLNWFGIYQSTRYDTVVSHFNNISATLEDQELSFDCSCNDDIYAYVTALSPKNIFLCNYFWPAPLLGTDSRAGVMVHEVSHFWAVANTVDFVYGQTACEALAVSAPDDAIDNADSHEYFAENTPFLSMAAYAGVNPVPWLFLLLD